MAEIKEEKPTTFFESIEFIFHHPWLFFSPFVVIMSVVLAQSASIPLKYKSYAVISFETGDKFAREDQKNIQSVTQKFILGENGDAIIKDVWPEADEIKDPQRFDDLRTELRQEVYRKYDPKTNLLSIAYSSADPDICYKVMESAIDSLKREIKKSTKRTITTGLEFLEKQEIYYREKITAMDAEISGIKSELKKKSKELSDEDRTLITEITGETDLAFRDKTTLQKLANYDEKLADLELQLLEKQRRRQALLNNMESGDYMAFLPETNPEKDIYVKQYMKLMADKELMVANLLSQGYLTEHPRIRSLRSEIEAIKQLKDQRITKITQGEEDFTKAERSKETRQRITAQLDEIELDIDMLEDKIRLLEEKYEQASPGGSFEKEDRVSMLATRFKELKEEREISQRYYFEIKKQLEEAKLKSRIEEAEAGLTIVVVERPRVPTSPIPFQKTPKIIWGVMLSLFIGTSFAYTAESLDNSVKSAAELRELLHIPILGSVDKISTVQEIRFKVLRRNVVALSLLAFALSARFLLKIRLFQLIFGFL